MRRREEAQEIGVHVSRAFGNGGHGEGACGIRVSALWSVPGAGSWWMATDLEALYGGRIAGAVCWAPSLEYSFICRCRESVWAFETKARARNALLDGRRGSD